MNWQIIMPLNLLSMHFETHLIRVWEPHGTKNIILGIKT